MYHLFLQEHGVALQWEWQQIHRAEIHLIIFNVPNRFRACVVARRGHTRY